MKSLKEPILNVEDYLLAYDGYDMTQKQKEEHIRVLWEIVQHFARAEFEKP